MVATVPVVTNWSVTPQNGQVGYFTLMNTWLFESTSVIDSLNTAIDKINEAGQDINNIGANAINAITLDTVEDFATYTGTGLVMVKDINRGGTFVSKTVIEIDPNTGSLYVANGGTVFAKLGGGFWVRQYSGAVNVKWFDTYQSAITFADTYFPSGDYNIDSSIQVPTGRLIYGDGSSTNFNIADGVTGFIASIDGARVSDTLMLKGITIRDVNFTGTTIDATIGIALNNVTSSLFQNITFNGLDIVISHGIVTGTKFENISNKNLEDGTTDCNYVIYSNAAHRSNDNIYTECICRASLCEFYLGGTLGAQHDGANITNNIFFPNTNLGTDNVFAYNMVWSTVIGNKFFVSARNGLRVEYACITSVISNNIFAWNGRYTENGAAAIYITTGVGSPISAHGQTIISDNIISMPTGEGVYINSLGSFRVSDNLIVSPNNIKSNSTGVYTKYSKDGISINGVSTSFEVMNNTVNTGIHGAGGESFATNWRYDVYVADTVRTGKVDHNGYNVKSKNGIENSYSDIARVDKGLKIPSSKRYQKSPYSITGFSQLTVDTAVIAVDGTILDPYDNGVNTGLSIVFPADVVSGVTRGEIATTAGGQLSMTFMARTTDKDIVRCTISIKENGGSEVFKDIDITPDWKEYFVSKKSTIAADYSSSKFQNNSNSAGGTIQIAGLRVNASNKYIRPFERFSGTTVPTVGFYHAGDIIENLSPVASGSIGWVCTAAGIPGTWKTFGNIGA